MWQISKIGDWIFFLFKNPYFYFKLCEFNFYATIQFLNKSEDALFLNKFTARTLEKKIKSTFSSAPTKHSDPNRWISFFFFFRKSHVAKKIYFFSVLHKIEKTLASHRGGKKRAHEAINTKILFACTVWWWWWWRRRWRCETVGTSARKQNLITASNVAAKLRKINNNLWLCSLGPSIPSCANVRYEWPTARIIRWYATPGSHFYIFYCGKKEREKISFHTFILQKCEVLHFSRDGWVNGLNEGLFSGLSEVLLFMIYNLVILNWNDVNAVLLLLVLMCKNHDRLFLWCHV